MRVTDDAMYKVKATLGFQDTAERIQRLLSGATNIFTSDFFPTQCKDGINNIVLNLIEEYDLSKERWEKELNDLSNKDFLNIISNTADIILKKIENTALDLNSAKQSTQVSKNFSIALNNIAEKKILALCKNKTNPGLIQEKYDQRTNPKIENTGCSRFFLRNKPNPNYKRCLTALKEIIWLFDTYPMHTSLTL